MTDVSMGRRLRHLRDKEGSTLDEVAARSGVSKSHLWALENDRGRRPSVAVVGALARYYGVSISWVVEGGSIVEAEDWRFVRDYGLMRPEIRARIRRMAKIINEEKEQT